MYLSTLYVCVTTFKLYSLSKFQLYNTVLATIVIIKKTVMISIRSPDFIHLTAESLYFQTLPIFPFPQLLQQVFYSHFCEFNIFKVKYI